MNILTDDQIEQMALQSLVAIRDGLLPKLMKGEIEIKN